MEMKKNIFIVIAPILSMLFIAGCSGKTSELYMADKAASINQGTPLSPEKGETFTNSIGINFVYIPSGTFTMGSPTDELGRNLDEIQHQVTITKGFYMQTTEVTQGQWKAVMDNNPSYFLNCGDDCPVENVSWYDVQEFIRRLNNLDGTKKYRLPSEAEWEYACRAGSKTSLANGNIKEGNCCYDSNLDAMGWYVSNSDGGTHPVARKKPNDWGLYDMHGNVWEWCQDWERKYPFINVTDATGPQRGWFKIRRGGGWNEYPRFCRSAYRSRFNPDEVDSHIGFRLVMNPVEVSPETIEPKSEPTIESEAPVVEAENFTLPDVTFDFDSSKIRNQMLPVVEDIVAVLKKSSKNIIIEGNTCDMGSNTYNQRLSERRAASVKTFFVNKGIDSSRIEIVGYGETMPKFDNSTQKGRSLNRRVEIHLK